MPIGLGRTQTVADYKYVALKKVTTLVDLRLSLVTVGPAMAFYAATKKRNIDDYLAQVMADNERTAVLLEAADHSVDSLLDESQCERVDNFRTNLDSLAWVPRNIKKEQLSSARQGPELVWQTELTELTEMYARVHGQARRLEDELVRIRETRDGVATLLVARRMLEVVAQQLCEEILKRPRGTEPLARVLEKLRETKALPEYVLTSMQNVNRLSIYGAHPKEFKPRQVREALIGLCSILEWHFDRPSDSEHGRTARS